jgi:prophage antirepressor-like protein
MNSLPKTIAFEGATLSVVDRNGQPWLQASDIGRALGYQRPDAITKIYERNSAEFCNRMTCTVKMTVRGWGQGKAATPVRIFSPRGCHLLAMLAKTDRAVKFRRWILDELEALAPATCETPSASRLGSPAHAEADRAARDWFARAQAAAGAGVAMPALNPQVLEGLVLEQLEHTRFLVSFDHEHRMRIEAVPLSSVVVPMGEAEDLQRFMERSVPPHFLPVALMAAASRLATAR